jgi:hypothetical protein
MNLKTSTGFTIEDVVWFTDMEGHCIGLVKGQSETGETKYYIGVGSGSNERLDTLLIAETGARFSPKIILGWEKQPVVTETKQQYALKLIDRLLEAGMKTPDSYGVTIPGTEIDLLRTELKEGTHYL